MPGGKPTSLMYSQILRAERGVVSADLITIALPVARAGPIFHENMAAGKFQGMIWPQTPMGSYLEYALTPGMAL